MRLNIENCARNGDEGVKAWALDELVCNLKEMRDRSNAGDMHAAVTEFFEVFRFSDNQTDPSPVRAAVQAAQPEAVGEPMASVEIFRLDANINGVDHQLVEFVRYEDHARVVHDLETICDPAGLVRENAQLRDTNEGLQRMYRAALSPAQQDAVDAWTEEDMDSLCWSAFESAMAGGVSVDSFRWLANSLRAKQLPQRAAISAKKGQP